MTPPNDRPPDTPAHRRYLQRHPEATDFSSAELTDHAYHQAQKRLQAIQRTLDQLDARASARPQDTIPSKDVRKGPTSTSRSVA